MEKRPPWRTGLQSAEVISKGWVVDRKPAKGDTIQRLGYLNIGVASILLYVLDEILLSPPFRRRRQRHWVGRGQGVGGGAAGQHHPTVP